MRNGSFAKLKIAAAAIIWGAAISAQALAQDGVTLEEIMPKIFLAYGGKEALAAFDKAYILIGDRSSEADGRPPAHIRQVRKGSRLRIDVQDADGTSSNSTVFDGAAAWKSSGTVVDELSGSAAQVLKDERDHEPSVLTHYMDPGYGFRLKGRTTYHAAPVYAIEVKHADGPAATFFVDEKNYQVLAVTYSGPDAKSVTMEYAEYRPASGTLFPFRQTQYVDSQPTSTLSVASIETGSNIDDAQFRRPDRAGQVRLSKAETIPFEYSHKEVLVKVRINDSEPLDFLFDTAASQTVVDRGVAAETFLAKAGSYTVTAIGGTVPAQTTAVEKLQLGDVELNKVQALILDLTPQTRQMGKRIAGIIGTNVINKFATTIDYAHSQIVLNDLETYKPAANATLVPFAQKRGPLVRAFINGKDVPFLIDTGAAFNNLPTRVARGFLTDQTPHITEGTGLDGRPVKLASLNVAGVKLGTQTVRNVNFTYSIDQDSLVQSKGVGQNGTVGVLGNPFWQNFAVTLDYKFERLVLQPNSTQSSRQEIDQMIATGDSKLTVYRDFRAAEAAYQKALIRVQALSDPRMQARIWGRIGNLRRVMAKDLNRPEQARVAYEYFSKAGEQAHKLADREGEGRILADWSLLYLDNGQVQAAQQALQGATLYAPQDPQVNVDFAVYLFKMQMYAEMNKYIEKALFLDPSNWQALWYKLKLADMFGDTEQAKATLRDILKYYPWSKLAQNKLAELVPPVVTPTQPGGVSGLPSAQPQRP